MTLPDRPLRLGTRGSALARTQSGLVVSALEALGVRVEIVPIVTSGDRSTAPLTQIGGTGVFVTAVRDALLADRCDLAVHSLKDLPVGGVAGLTLAAVPARANVRDALCARDGYRLADLPPGAVIGTGSRRRALHLTALRPDLRVVGLRGNVDSRLERVRSGELDAVVLAAAGLDRLGLLASVTEFFAPLDSPPAPGQGALAIECRSEDEATVALLAALDDRATRHAVIAERAVLARLDAGCTAPVGAWGRIDGDELLVDALIWREGGDEPLRARAAWPIRAAGGSTTESAGADGGSQAVAGTALDAAATGATAGSGPAGSASTASATATRATTSSGTGLTEADAAALGTWVAEDLLRQGADAVEGIGGKPAPTIVVPIPADGSARWEDCAREAGLVPESIELLSAEYEQDAPAVAALVADLGRGSYTHLALTSSRALTALKRAGEPLAAVQRVGGFTVAAIGPATAAAAIAAGLSVGLVPAEDHSAHGLAAGLLRTRHAAGSAAIPHSDLADGRLAAELRGAEWRVDEVIAYRIHAALPAVTDWSLRPPDLVFLTSGSAAHAWHQLIAATPAIRGAGAIVLGRGAADAAAALGIPVIATATAADAPSLTRAMRNAREIVNGHNEGGKTRPPPPAPTEGA